MGINQIKKAESYGQRMKLQLKVTNLQQELEQVRNLVGQLRETHTQMTHSVTGIVYDLDVIQERMENIQKEIDHCEDML